MSTALSSSTFLDYLHRSAVLDDAQYQELLVELQQNGLAYAEGLTVAKYCVKQAYLTPFQAQQLVKGKWRNFVVGGKYLVLEPIGTGGMGAVFRCRHLALHKDVALKVLPAAMTNDPVSLERFLREAHALASLNHPNIVQAHDCDENKGQYFLVMSYVEGVTLQQLVEKEGPLAVPRAAYYLSQACRGLHHAHEAGWMHRDLKPSNLVIDRTDTLKILDLGLARMMDDSHAPLTKKYDEKGMLGSPDYISPEQSLNAPDLDIRSDIYSLGATFYYLLAGHAPFEGLQVVQKLLAHQLTEPEDVSLFRSDIPPELNALLRRMMAKKREERFATPGDVADALLPWSSRYQPAPETLPISGRRASQTMRFRSTVAPKSMSDSGTSSTVSGRLPEEVTADLVAPGPMFLEESTPPVEPPAEETPLQAAPWTRQRLLTLAGGGLAVVVTIGLILFFLFWGSNDPDALLQRAEEHCQAKHWKSAADIYVDLLTRLPANDPRRKTVLAKLRTWKHVLPLVIERMPEEKQLQLHTGMYLAGTKDWRGAWKCLSNLGNEAPEKDAVYWNTRGEAAVYCGELVDAARSLDKVAQLKPNDVTTWRKLAVVAVATHQPELHRQACSEMLKRFGTSENMQTYAEITYACGMAPLPKEMLDKASELGTQAVQAQPTVGWYFFALGMVEYQRGQTARCLELWQEAKKVDPTWAALKLCEFGKLLVLQKTGRKEEAATTQKELETWLTEQQRKNTNLRFHYLEAWWDAVALEAIYAEAADKGKT
jgi:serine/threonine protein kinase